MTFENIDAVISNNIKKVLFEVWHREMSADEGFEDIEDFLLNQELQIEVEKMVKDGNAEHVLADAILSENKRLQIEIQTQLNSKLSVSNVEHNI